ncbi:hypothetical protein AKJ39_02730 [candidate division MSBL1 archaeon SCGC-AAA259J03]|uniref:Uncharacterized protein n=1 Tax=candidate division MSBL1 archaeon SCGC-AAA259J03 TaxID=1698269 RepID=A0A656YWN5_9EURY|nr:hypothetical protein AKJ39_02730 [candidate division MSBL1 archaeon SCGC-AAA259J03]
MTKGKINYLIKKERNLNPQEISTETQRRALKDLVELNLVKKKDRRYTERKDHEKQKQMAVEALQKGLRETADERGINTPEVRRKTKKIIEEAGFNLEFKVGWREKVSVKKRKEIIEKVKNL